MQKSAMRITCAFLLLSIALASCVGLISAVFAENDTPPETAAPVGAVREAPQTASVPSEADKPSLVLVKMLILADPEIRQVRLLRRDGTLLQSLTPDAEGMAVTDPMEPGDYTAETEQGSVSFTLHENASVSTGAGCGWTDGEQLHLTRTQVGTLTVRRLLAQDDPAAAGGWLDYTLSSASYYDRAVVRRTDGTQTELSCTFYGIPYGEYVLSENGAQCARVTIGPGEETVSVLLP